MTAAVKKFDRPSQKLKPSETASGATAPLRSPPAIWTAFALQARWKSWALLASFALNFLLALAAIGFADKPPDVVVVDAATGKSTYLNRSLAGPALVRFLDEQRQEPSDITVVHFTQEFLKTFLAVNSSTIEAAWPDALAMMAPELRARISAQADEKKSVQTYKLAGIRTQLNVEDVVLVERHGDLLHVRGTLARSKVSLLDGSGATVDRLQVDLVERIVPRSPARPDGLELVEYSNTVLSCDGPLCPKREVAGAVAP